jgi:hypothetical protein
MLMVPKQRTDKQSLSADLTENGLCRDTWPYWTEAMFEISIFCVILLAISYWVVLFLMGRREDVLHGEFVKADAQPEEAVRSEPVRSVFPERPALPQRPVFPEKPVIGPKPVIEKPVVSPKPADITKPVRAAAPEQPAFRPERLESLLNSIKQDLNQLVQK